MWHPRDANVRCSLKPMTRFWLQVWPRGDCWEYRGHRDETGYGIFTQDGERFKAHRIAFVAAKGEIPTGLHIDHLCRHRWCVKPSHLEAVDCATNLLRGDGVCARQRRKTHCKRGHPFAGDNLHVGKRGRRTCLRCRREKWRAWNEAYRHKHGKSWKGN